MEATAQATIQPLVWSRETHKAYVAAKGRERYHNNPEFRLAKIAKSRAREIAWRATVKTKLAELETLKAAQAAL